MPAEPEIWISHAGVSGVVKVPLAAFTATWEPLGWVEAVGPGLPTEVYLIPSSEKNAPFGVATLDASGFVVEPGGGGGGGGLTVGEVNALIDDKLADLTYSDVGAMSATADVVLFQSDVLEIDQRATHPSVVAGKAQLYQLTDGSFWIQLPSGQRTQLGPPFVHLDVELAAEKTVNSLTLSTALAVDKVEPSAVYKFEVLFAYEATVAASGERLRCTFDPPPGSTGFYAVQSLAVTQAAANGSASYIAKKLAETFDVGGSGAGTANVRYARFSGWLYTDDHDPYPSTEALFEFKVRLSTLDGAGVPLVPAKIYGANTVDFDAARMRLERVK